MDAKARVFPEACIETLRHVLQKKDDWSRANSLAAFTQRDDGGLELTPSSAALISHGASDSNWTTLDRRAAPFNVAKVSWLGTDPADLRLSVITARLHPKVTGAAKEVAFWEMHVYTEIPIGYVSIGGSQLVEIADPLRIEATGTAEADYTFAYNAPSIWPYRRWLGLWGAGGGPQPKKMGLNVMYIEIRPLKADGSIAGNVAWRKDSATASVTTSDNVLTGALLTPSSTGTPEDWVETALNETPRVAIQRLSATGTTVDFSTNPMDLGAVPTGSVEFIGEGETPGGSSFTFEVRNNADSAWIPFTSGQTNDALGVSLRQTYKMRATFNPAGTNVVCPILRQLGARAVTLQSFDLLATVTGGQGSIDPETLQGEIARVKVRALQDGTDYRSAIAELLSSYDIGDIAWRVWVGHPDLPRYQWLLIDTFITDEVITEEDGSVSISCISPLSLLKTHLPEFAGDPTVDYGITSITRVGSTATVTVDAAAHGLLPGMTIYLEGATGVQYNGEHTISGVRGSTPKEFDFVVEGAPATPDPTGGAATYYRPTQVPSLTYNRRSLKAVAADIVDNRMRLPSQWRGQLIEDDITLVSKVIQDSEGKAELDALGFLAGGGHISSQGRLQFKDIFGAKTIVATIPREEIGWGQVSPGYSKRKPQFRVPYDFDFAFDRYRNEVRSFNQTALDAMGQPWGELQDLDDLIAKWIISDAITSITRAGAVATVTTTDPHGLTSGQTVTIGGAVGDGAPDVVNGGFNGDVVVTVTGASTFTYAVSGTPTSPATGGLHCGILPHVVGNRTVRALGAGRMLLPFTTTYPHPELEVGDLIAVQTDRIIMKDPFGNRALRGKVWAIGVVQAVFDLAGTAFTLFIRSLADIVSGTVAAKRLGFALPEVLSAAPEGEPDGTIRAFIQTKEAQSVRIAVSTTDYPDRTTVQASAVQAVNTEGNLATGTLDTISEGDTLYGSILAYEEVNGTGAESDTMGQFTITRVPAVSKTLRFTCFQGVDPIAGQAAPTPFTRKIAYQPASGWVQPDGAGSGSPTDVAFLNYNFPVPIGTTLKAIRCEIYGDADDDATEFHFYRLASASGGLTELANAQISRTTLGWEVLSDTMNELVSAGDSYMCEVDLRGINSSAANVRHTYIEVDYDSPSYYETY